MLIKINEKTNFQEIDALLSKLKSRKAFRSKDFLGKIKWGEDALEYQKRLRDEWN